MPEGNMDFLSKIAACKKEEVGERKGKHPIQELKDRVREMPATRDFGLAISRDGSSRIIAELKKASPSAGIIRKDFKPSELAQSCEKGGAAALSVLTDEGLFQGELGYINEVRESCRLPILRKDFIVSEYQVYESRAAGADAFLLITALLEKAQLQDYIELGIGLGMNPLVEVHTLKELDRALSVGAEIVGINNRDLRTFRTDINVSFNLVKDVPDESIVVSESGITNRAEIEKLMKAGVDAFLIGEEFMKASDIEKRIKELIGKTT